MSFMSNHTYYGYTDATYAQLEELECFPAISNYFIKAVYDGQELWWIDEEILEDYDFGTILADMTAVYAQSVQALKPL